MLVPPGTAAAQDADVVEELPKAAIDMDRVARDLEDVASKSGTVTIWSFEERSKTKLEEGPPVPMFMPAEVAADLADGAEVSKGVVRESGGVEGDTRIMNFDDEYFIVRQYGNVRVTVHGTRKVFSTEPETARKAAEGPAPDYAPVYSATYAGAQVNFGYAGAHYLVEFECSEDREGVELTGKSCVSENDAMKIVDAMALCSGDMQCIDKGTELIRRP
jgi:hypothetical protein